MTSMPLQKIVAILPARWGSTRLPGKPLIDIKGLPLIERVRRQVLQCKLVSEVLVATDDERILNAVRTFGGSALMTRSDHHSGTDRLAEVIKRRPDITVAVNVQGDEPCISPSVIDAAIQPLVDDSSIQMTTIACPVIQEPINNPNIVKVVTDKQGFALYFSRATIPFVRDSKRESTYLHHAGLYVYGRDTLLKLSTLAPSTLELSESLEQLRALENGIRIKVIQTPYRPQEVNVHADIAAVEAILTRSSPSLSLPVNFPL